jgi:cell wall-associated NlpC family hydrolase
LLYPGARAFAGAALAATFIISALPPSPASAADPTEASQVTRIARAQSGDRWRYGATGPSAFDCSGLVTYAYRMAGDLRLIGNGKYRSAAALYRYFRLRGKVSRTTATPGDLVIWGNGSHVGIYLGRGMAVSTLTSGVRVHAVRAVSARFTAYLRTGIYQLAAPRPVAAVAPSPPPSPSPTPSPSLSESPIPAVESAAPGS